MPGASKGDSQDRTGLNEGLLVPEPWLVLVLQRFGGEPVVDLRRIFGGIRDDSRRGSGQRSFAPHEGAERLRCVAELRRLRHRLPEAELLVGREGDHRLLRVA